MSENSESMIERVARAICLADGRVDPDAPALGGGFCWMNFERQTRAAIGAMREPTREMLNGGDEMMPQFSEADKHLTGFDVSREVWQAMIGTALGEDHP